MPVRAGRATTSSLLAAIVFGAFCLAGCTLGRSSRDGDAGAPSLGGRLAVLEAADFHVSGTLGAITLSGATCSMTYFMDGSFLLAGSTAGGEAVVATGSYSDHQRRRVLGASALCVGRERVEAPCGASALDGSSFVLGPLEATRIDGPTPPESIVSARLYRFSGRTAEQSSAVGMRSGTAYGLFGGAGRFLLVTLDDDGGVLMARGFHAARTDGVAHLDFEHAATAGHARGRVARGRGTGAPDFSRLMLTAAQDDGTRSAAVFQEGLARTPSPPE